MKTLSIMRERNLNVFSQGILSLKEIPEAIPFLIYLQID